MKIIIDFDDVLFDTRDFRQEYIKVFAAHGINRRIFEKYYNQAITFHKSIVLYDPEKHLKVLKKREGIITDNLRKSIYNFAADSKKYIFKDVYKFLSAIGKNNIFIVTHSKSQFQKTKLKNCGLKKRVNKIIMTGKLKSCAIKMLKKQGRIKTGEKVLFLDDRVEQIEDVKKNYPSVITIFVKRREGRYKDKKNKYCDFGVKNLKEAYSIIKHKD